MDDRSTCSPLWRAASIVIVAMMLSGCAALHWHRSHPGQGELLLYYPKTDGRTLVPYGAPLPVQTDLPHLARAVVATVLAGPELGVSAVRFPAGTLARSVTLEGSVATVDLSQGIEATPAGGFAENAEFKALVWSLTALPGITQVQIRVAGQRISTLPGGHFELDEPLSRSDW